MGGASVGDHDLVNGHWRPKASTMASFDRDGGQPGIPNDHGGWWPIRVIGLPGNPVLPLFAVFLFSVSADSSGCRALQHPSRQGDGASWAATSTPRPARKLSARAARRSAAAGDLSRDPVRASGDSLWEISLSARALVIHVRLCAGTPKGSLCELLRRPQ